MTRPIVCASDFGYRNEWVGICHAVMSRVAPASRIVDLSHGVPPLDVLVGALHLVDSLPHVDEDAVDVAIVDPNVGQDRDVALETKSGRLLVGPDNGLLIPVSASLGVERGFEITAEQIILQPVAPSFHARDVLCPAAAHLAAGMAIEELGPALDPDTVVLLSVPEPVVEPGRVQGEVLDMNRFGNVELNIRPEHLAAAGLEGLEQLAIEAASGSTRARRATTYADVDPDEYGVFVDHRGWLTMIRGNPGNAAAGLGVQVGDLIWITPVPSADDDRAQEREPETEGDEQLVEGRFPL